MSQPGQPGVWRAVIVTQSSICYTDRLSQDVALHTTPHHTADYQIYQYQYTSVPSHQADTTETHSTNFDRNIVGLSALLRHFNIQIRFYWNKNASICGHCDQLVETVIF